MEWGSGNIRTILFLIKINIIQKPCGRHHDLWHRSASRYLLLELGLYCQWTEIVLATRWSNFMKSTIKTIDWSYLKKSPVYFFTSIKSSTVPYQNIYIIFFKQNFPSKYFHYPLLLSLIQNIFQKYFIWILKNLNMSKCFVPTYFLSRKFECDTVLLTNCVGKDK